MARISAAREMIKKVRSEARSGAGAFERKIKQGADVLDAAMRRAQLRCCLSRSVVGVGHISQGHIVHGS